MMPVPAQPPSAPRDRAPWPRRAFSHTVGVVRRALDWIGGHELSVVLVLLAILLSIWGFMFLAGEVADGDTPRFDEWALRALRRPNDLSQPLGPQWLAEVGRDLTALGGHAVLAIITLIVVGFLWLRRMYGAMTLVLVATLGGVLVSSLLKDHFHRPRPNLVPHLMQVYSSSFPSGHSMLSATVYLTLGTLLGQFVRELRVKAYFLLVALGLTLLVGVSRVYLGVHYPTDVLAGWSAGLAWALLCWLIARVLQRRGAVEPEMDS